MKRRHQSQKATLRAHQITAPARQSAPAVVAAALPVAIQHLQAGQIDHAEAILRQVLNTQPSNPVALHLLGAIALQAGRHKVAADLIGKAVALKPDIAEAHNNLGSAFLNQGQHDAAAASYQKAIALRPSYAKAFVNLGVARTHQGKLDEAIACFRKAIALAPNIAQVHNNLGSALTKQGMLDEAIDSFRTTVALNPDYVEAHYNLGNALTNQDKLAEAAAWYRRAITLDPNFAEAHNNLGIALNDQAFHEEAVASQRKAIALRPSFAEAHSSLGTALNDQGRHDEAVASQQKAIALKPDLAEAHNGLGLAFERQGQLGAALACYQKAMALKPGYAQAHHNAGIALEHQGQLEAALDYYHKAIALDGACSFNHYGDANDHKFLHGDPEIEMLHRLVALDGLSEADKSPIRYALGKAHDDIGRYREAFSHYSTANEEMASQGDFDPSRHRKKISAIKEMFRERRGADDQNAGDSEQLPVFVIGMSRSGKTSVESLMAQHDDVYGGAESHEWRIAVNAVLDKYSISTSFPEYMGFLSDDQIREIGEIYMRNIANNYPDSKYFVNTMPENDQFIGIILQALPKSRIIFCRRDSMDHCLFVYFYLFGSGNYYSYDLNHLASYYTVCHDLMTHWKKLYGDRILSVRYEDLVGNPADTCARIYAFCGLDFDPAAMRHTFTTDEIGHWKHYEPYLDTLREALGTLAK